MNRKVLFINALWICCIALSCSSKEIANESSSQETHSTSSTPSLEDDCVKLKEFSDTAGDVFDYSSSSNNKVDLRLYVKGLGNDSIKQWFDTGTEEELVGLIKKIHRLADKFGLNRWGFNFAAPKSRNYLEMSSNHVKTDNLTAQTIKLDGPSFATSPDQFKPYVDKLENYDGHNKDERQVRSSTHSASFFSHSGKRMVIMN